MEGRLLFKNCGILKNDGRARKGLAVVVEGACITRIAPDAEVPVLPGDWAVSCDGRTLTTGRVDCHAHLVDGLAREVDAHQLAQAHPAGCKQRLASALTLTAQEVQALAAFSMARALRHGFTCVYEHLFAPHAVEAGLQAEAVMAEQLGLRLCASHASHALEGAPPAKSQVRENLAFIQSRPDVGLVTGGLGFFSPALLDDTLLAEVGAESERLRTSLHFHLAGSESDVKAAFELHGAAGLQRLASFGLLSPRSVAFGARALDEGEWRLLRESHTFIAWSPRDELLLPSVGTGAQVFLQGPVLRGFASGGVASPAADGLAALASVTALARGRRALDPDALLMELFFSGPAELVGRTVGQPCGAVEEGMLADLVLYDAVVPDEADAAPALLWQLFEARPAWVVVNGRVSVREGQLLGADYLELAREAARVLQTRRS